MPRLINSIEEYVALTEIYSTQKIYCNDYIQSNLDVLIKTNSLYELHTENNLFLFVKKAVGYRLYYYISDTSDVVNFAEVSNVVVEILYRGEKYYPQGEVEYLIKCGFEINLVRDQYCGVYKDLKLYDLSSDIQVLNAKNIEDVNYACTLFNSSFDTLSGDYISESEYTSLLDKNQIFIAIDNQNNYLGALHQTIEKGVAWISHVAVQPESKGMGVGKLLVNNFIKRNYTTEKQRYMLWVQHQNNVAVSMYENFGFKYLNKSTISLIKK